MLTTEDIKKLTSILASKEDIKGIKGDFSSLAVGIQEFKDSTKKEFTSLRSETKSLKDYTEKEFISLKADVKEIKAVFTPGQAPDKMLFTSLTHLPPQRDGVLYPYISSSARK